MLTAAELAAMRATSTAAMPDTVQITRQSGEAVLDEVDGDNDYPPPTVIYTGPGRVRPADTQERDLQSGDLHQTLANYVATVPYNAGNILVDDYLEVTASTDADMVGRAFQVRHVGYGAWQIDRRLGIEDAEQPRDVQ